MYLLDGVINTDNFLRTLASEFIRKKSTAATEIQYCFSLELSRDFENRREG